MLISHCGTLSALNLPIKIHLNQGSFFLSDVMLVSNNPIWNAMERQ